MSEDIETMTGNREQRRSAMRTKKAAALGSGVVLATAGASAAVTLMSSAPAAANAPIVVDSLTDDGTGTTLRDAIEQANTDAGQDTITFSVTGTITLSSSLPHITDALKIQGPGAGNLTVDGDDTWAIFNFYRIYATDGANEVSGITVTGGVADNRDDSGGGIVVRYGDAPMTIANAVITDNYASDDGGGINLYFNFGPTVITGTTISNNTAHRGGGGLYADTDTPSTIEIIDSQITGNTAGRGGGGLYNRTFALTIENSTISGNTAEDGGGGGLYVADEAHFTMTNSVVSGNTATGDEGGGIRIDGAVVDIEFSTISGNTVTDDGGGGIFLDSDSSVYTFEMHNSTVSGNTAQYYGGGLYVILYGGQSTIENSTISGNTGHQAGAVYGAYSGLNLIQVTITDNHATDPSNDTAVGGVQMTGGAGGASVRAQARAAERSAKAASANEDKNEKHAGGRSAARHGGAHGAAAVGSIDAIGTIISGNDGQDVGVYSGYVTVDSDHSILGVVDPSVVVNDLGGTQLAVTNPGLLPLADNGGPTKTHALAPGSPAKNTGPVPAPVFTDSEYDQRGVGYARVSDGRIDVGAFEEQVVTPVIEPKFTG